MKSRLSFLRKMTLNMENNIFAMICGPDLPLGVIQRTQTPFRAKRSLIASVESED